MAKNDSDWSPVASQHAKAQNDDGDADGDGNEDSWSPVANADGNGEGGGENPDEWKRHVGANPAQRRRVETAAKRQQIATQEAGDPEDDRPVWVNSKSFKSFTGDLENILLNTRNMSDEQIGKVAEVLSEKIVEAAAGAAINAAGGSS